MMKPPVNHRGLLCAQAQTPPSPGTSFLLSSDGETDTETLADGLGLTETLADGTTGTSSVVLVMVGIGSGSSLLSSQAATENAAAAIRAMVIGSFFMPGSIGTIFRRRAWLTQP